MSKILGFLSKLNPQKSFDTIAGGIDKLAFTQQERADLNVLLADKVADYAKDTLSENTVRSKARRLIAYCIVFVYLSVLIAGIFIDNEHLRLLATNSPIQTAFIMVLAFFFGGYYLKGISPTRIKNK